MAKRDWWKHGIIYQIYPRSFKDTTGNGVGDLQGIIDKLDYLNDGTEQSLGIDAIWISPFYSSPMADFGYDVSNYTDVDPLFGDLETFDKLVEEAHKRNIKVVVDYVPNHTSNEHPWFRESRSSKDNPKRDWYIWKDPKADGSPPNNWGSMFGGRAWTFDETTEQYYFHQFAPEQPDLNWRNPKVREAMMNVLRFWMARGVDGFRMDVVYVIWKHPDMPDQPVIRKGRSETDAFAQQQQIYSFNYEGIQDIMAEIRATLDEHDAVGIAELWLSVEERMEYYSTFEMPFNFDLVTEDVRDLWDAAHFRAKINAYEAAIPEGKFPNYVLGNHDIPRLASRYGSEERARAAAMMLLTLRGTPTLYAGDELGMVNGEIKTEQIVDPQGLILGVAHTRDVTRTPFQWDASEYAGFSTVETWLPVHSSYKTRNAKTLSDDEQSILSLYRQLIWYRKTQPSLTIGAYESLQSPDNTFVYTRTHDGETHWIAINFGSDPVSINLPRPGEIVCNSLLTRTGTADNIMTLQSDEAILIKLA